MPITTIRTGIAMLTIDHGSKSAMPSPPSIFDVRSFALRLVEAFQSRRCSESAYQADSDYASNDGDADGSVAEDASVYH
jgi:hypothetical protein